MDADTHQASPKAPWVIFDGDNTLWPIEHLYNEARTSLCRLLAARGVDLSAAEQYQQERDRCLFATYGYSSCRFARSFEDTILHFVPSASDGDVQHVRGLAMQVFEQQVNIEDGLSELLNDIQRVYKLGIITAGERWVQERRLSHFQLRSLFSTVEIVEVKRASVFSQYCEKNHVDAARSWVVGDSINSDINPALEAGLRAIHVNADNWHRVEGRPRNLPSEVPSVRSIIEIRPYLLV